MLQRIRELLFSFMASLFFSFFLKIELASWVERIDTRTMKGRGKCKATVRPKVLDAKVEHRGTQTRKGNGYWPQWIRWFEWIIVEPDSFTRFNSVMAISFKTSPNFGSKVKYWCIVRTDQTFFRFVTPPPTLLCDWNIITINKKCDCKTGKKVNQKFPISLRSTFNFNDYLQRWERPASNKKKKIWITESLTKWSKILSQLIYITIKILLHGCKPQVSG